MYKIMIVDDETISTDSIKYIIEKNFSDVEIVAIARSGREAIEQAENNVPDIIFMDIRMPGINGIEAIKQIKHRHSQIAIIVLTAFEEFDFAKEAIKMGVLEYLLKPVNRTKIVEAVKKAMEVVKAQKEKLEIELEMKEKMEYVIPILENGFIYSIILFDDNSIELQNYKRIFEIQESGGYVVTVEFGDDENNGEFGNKIGYSVRSQYFYQYFRDTANSLHRCIIGPVMLNRIVLFIPERNGTEQFSDCLNSVDFAEKLLKRLSEKVKCDFKIGIGRCYDRLELMSVSYEESLKTLRYIQSRGVMHFIDIPSDTVQYRGLPEQKEKLLMQKVSLGDIDGSINEFNHIFDWLLLEYGDQTLKIKNKLLEIVFFVNRIAWENDASSEKTEIRFLEEMLSIEDTNELRFWCKKRIETTAERMNSYRGSNISGLAKSAKNYIDMNYSKQLTLEGVSKEINVSPQYLSKLFKEETGENFIDYLTSVRIKVAKNLLESGELSIKEICYSVGYSDPNYLSRLFKKITGVTPTDYKI